MDKPFLLTVRIMIVSTALLGALLATAPPAPAAAGDLVISEIMYHPADDDDATSYDDYEYVELFNPTSSTIELASMSWGAGISGTFTGGSIPPGGYGIVSPDAATATAQYGGVTPVGSYTGKLSNGGEELTLLDTDGVTVVDSVTYDDGNGWPSAADGDGPSLELTDTALDNALAASWLASSTPTPGAPNSVAGVAAPIVNIVASPSAPQPGVATVISADINGASTATLTYKINVDDGDDDAGIPVVMRDDGVAPDTVADDGNFAASIPARASGDLLRYRIDTDSGAASPELADSIEYYGLVVDDPVTTNLEILRTWMGPNDWADMDTSHRFSDVYFPVVIEFEGVVYDSSQIKIRGGDFARKNYIKQSYSIELPSGHEIISPTYFGYPVDEFALQGERNWVRAHEGWWLFEQAGFPHVESLHVHVEQNNEFFGLYRIQEKLDGKWRKANDLDDGQFFKAVGDAFRRNGWDKKSPKDGDYTKVNAFDALVQSSPSSAKTQAVYEQIDIPNLINYAATNTFLRNADIYGHNFYVYFDEGNTDRWRIYPWDLDHSFQWTPGSCPSDLPAVEPACFDNGLLDTMWEQPEFQSMYFRRLRTLLDGPIGASTIDDDVDAILAATEPEFAANYATWSYNPKWGDLDFDTDIAARRNVFANEPRVPTSQPAAPGIVINEIHYKGAGADPDFVELYNSTNDWIDLSGWELDGTGLTIAGGTVIAPNGYIVFTADDVAFRNFYGTSTSHILAQFPAGLSNGGETIELKNADGTTVDSVTYDDGGRWPTAPDGNGPSLELISPTLDNGLAASWGPSTAPAGSPGQANNTEPPPAEVEDPELVIEAG